MSKYSEYRPKSRKRVKIYNINKFVNSKINTVYFYIKSFFMLGKINRKDRIYAINIHSVYHDMITPLLLHLFFKIPLLIKPASDFITQQRELFVSKPSALFSQMAYYGWMKFFRTFIVKRKKIYFQAIKDQIYDDLLKLKVNKKNIIKIPNGISVNRYLKIKKYNKKETHFGYVGRLIKSKNLDFLLNSFKEYLSTYENDKLYIFGKGTEESNISEFIIKNKLTKNIILMGFEQRKEKIYYNIDALIHPTFGEGCPNTILESSLTKTFIIASKVSGIRDIIVHKKSGLLFNPFKEKDLVEQLFYYKQNQERVPNILETAKEKIIERYDVNVIANKIYRFLLSKHKSKKTKNLLTISIITPVFPYPNRGILPGIERYVESFAFPLMKRGIKVKLITTFWNGGSRNDVYKNIPILRIKDSKSLFGKIGSIFHINNITFGLNLIRKKNFSFFKDSDIIIMPLAIGFTSLIKMKKIPIVSCFLHYDQILSLVEHFNTPIYHLLEKRQFKKQKRIITVSNGSKEDIVKHYEIDEKNIKVFPIGVDLKRFNPLKKLSEIREKYGNTILFYSGPMIPRKRVSILLFAMSKVIKIFPEVKLLLLGDGLYLKRYQRLAKKLKINNHLVWVGFVENPEIYYASSDLFVFPSELEGFGQVITESMACGTPVICTDKPPMSEIVAEGGVTFRLNDSNDLAAKIIDLLSNRQKLKNLSEKAIIRAKEFECLNVIDDI